MLDDRVRQHEVERLVGERQEHAVGEREREIPKAALAPEPDPGVLEPIRRIAPHNQRRLLRE